MGYTAYVLDEESRQTLLRKVPPKFSDVIAHHVTESFNVTKMVDFHPGIINIQVIGYSCNTKVEAVVVQVFNKTHNSSNMLYHITLSLDGSRGAKPFDSNKMLWETGWESIPNFTLTATHQFINY